MNFSFSPELFEMRGEASEILENAGISYFADYSSIDCIHDLYGLEVCGLANMEMAKKVLMLLGRRFKWPHGRCVRDDDGKWRAEIFRNKPEPLKAF